MRGYMFEGSVAEVTEALRRMGVGSETAQTPPVTPEVTQGSEEEEEDDDDEVEFVDVGVARRTLTRIPLSAEQTKVLKALYEAGDAGVLASKLQSVTKYSKGQFAGLMGAFGRRVSHTRGYVDGSWFFRQDWDREEGCYRYWLPEASREAVRRELIEE